MRSSFGSGSAEMRGGVPCEARVCGDARDAALTASSTVDAVGTGCTPAPGIAAASAGAPSSVGPANRPNMRAKKRPTSSTRVNSVGTNSSDSSVDAVRPPMTAIAIGERNSPPAPIASALGAMPAAIAMVVITIGRARIRPASMMAVVRSTPRRIASMAKSTSMMAFLVTMPISIRMPITTGALIGLLVASSADDGAAERQRQRDHDGQRLQQAAEQHREHDVDHHQAVAHRRAEAVEQLGLQLGVAGLGDADAGRQALHHRQVLDRRHRAC